MLTLLFILVGNAASAAQCANIMLPPVLEVQRQAIKHAQYDLAQITSMKKQSRLAALVPRLQVDFGKRMRDNIDIDINDNVYVGASGIVVGPEDGKYSNGYTSDISIGVRAVWELGEAIFNPRALAVSAEARHVAQARNVLLADVNHHYFNVEGFPAEIGFLKELKQSTKNAEKIEHKILMRQVACKESSAALDALTGGWWSNAIDKDAKLCDLSSRGAERSTP
ncbi:MAG: hypothetical protein ABH871_03130 [Pseudomonadota bacterium]